MIVIDEKAIQEAIEKEVKVAVGNFISSKKFLSVVQEQVQEIATEILDSKLDRYFESGSKLEDKFSEVVSENFKAWVYHNYWSEGLSRACQNAITTRLSKLPLEELLEFAISFENK